MSDADLAYPVGYTDYQAGKSIYDNPFPEGTVEFRRWVDGRVQAIIDERAAGQEPAEQ